jgi:hypothetical protein
VLYAISEPMVFQICSLVCDKLNRDAKKPLSSDFLIRKFSKKIGQITNGLSERFQFAQDQIQCGIIR